MRNSVVWDHSFRTPPVKREPLYELGEIAERLRVSMKYLTGLMSQSVGRGEAIPKPVFSLSANASRSRRGVYKYSEFRAWFKLVYGEKP